MYWVFVIWNRNYGLNNVTFTFQYLHNDHLNTCSHTKKLKGNMRFYAKPCCFPEMWHLLKPWFFDSSDSSGPCTRHSWCFSSCLHLYVPVSPSLACFSLTLFSLFLLFHTCFHPFFNSLWPLPMSTFSLSSLILTFCFSVEQIDFLVSGSTEASLEAVQPLCCFEILHSLTGWRPGRQRWCSQKSVNINKCLKPPL